MSQSEPIRVIRKDGAWHVDYGSYVTQAHQSRHDAADTATVAARVEDRDLTIEKDR